VTALRDLRTRPATNVVNPVISLVIARTQPWKVPDVVEVVVDTAEEVGVVPSATR